MPLTQRSHGTQLTIDAEGVVASNLLAEESELMKWVASETLSIAYEVAPAGETQQPQVQIVSARA